MLEQAVLQVTDPRGVCGRRVASHLRAHPHPDADSVIWNDFWIIDDWELGSELARPLVQSVAEPAAVAPLAQNP